MPTAQQLPEPIIAARANLLMQHPFFASHLLTKQRITFDPATPSAKTNGKALTLGDWFAARPLPQRVFVLCHEVMHDILGHMDRARMYTARGFGPDMNAFDAKRWNKATDYYVNSLLTASRIGVMPSEGLLDPRYGHTLTADQIYELLDPTDPDDQDPDSGNFDEHEDAPGEDPNGQPTPTPNQADLDEQVKQNLTSAKAAQEAAGKDLPGALAKAVGAITDPQVDWREQLRDFVQIYAGKDETSWSRLNRRRMALPPHIPYPGKTGNHLESMVIAIDASGSIGETEMSMFLAEMRAIVEQTNPKETWILFWDTGVTAVEVMDPEDIEQLEPYGGGGTNYSCVAKWLEDNELVPDVTICLTDGWVDWPQSDRISSPHLTVMTTDYLDAPFGKTIRLTTTG
jgi:predicted metal-dependent peptidase